MTTQTDYGNGQQQQSHGTQEPEAAKSTHPFEPFWKDIVALREYAVHYTTARVDTIKYRARRVLIWAAVGLLAATASLIMLITAMVLLLQGVASGLADLLGGRRWAGDLITGSFLLIGMGVVVFLAIFVWVRSSRQKTVKKYDRHRI